MGLQAPPRRRARPTPATMQLISLVRVFDIWIYLSIRVQGWGIGIGCLFMLEIIGSIQTKV